MTKLYSKKALAKNRNAVTRKRLGGKTMKMRGGEIGQIKQPILQTRKPAFIQQPVPVKSWVPKPNPSNLSIIFPTKIHFKPIAQLVQQQRLIQSPTDLDTQSQVIQRWVKNRFPTPFRST